MRERAGRRMGWAVGCVVALVLSLLAGYLVAGGLSSALAISFQDKEVPGETPSVADAVEVEPLRPLGAVRVGDDGDPLLRVARDALSESFAGRATAGSAQRVEVEISEDAEAGPEGYAVTDVDGVLRVSASDRRGAAYGLFHLADTVAAGRQWDDAVTDGVVEPVLADRFVDTGAVGVQPDPEAYRLQQDYQHASGALEDVVLSEEPYVDQEGLATARAEWKEFIDHVVAYGYNGVVVPGFLEYVNFDRYGDGEVIYPADSPYRARHEVMKREVGAMWRYAHDLGLRVVFKFDMLALTGPLERHLQAHDLDAGDDELWRIYRAGLDELLADFEWADGFMVRIGEGGSIYNLHGWDYYSALEVTDAAAVRTMLTTFTDVAAEHDATVYFRTWSVGVGDVGDMHTNPQTYERLFDGLAPDNLVVSTKFTMGDFDSWLPLNPTLAAGEQRRLVEMQGRREFEAFSSIPDDVGPAHQTALRSFLADNDRVDGLWLWTQDGGPWRAGPMSLYLKTGLWQLYDLNVYTAGRLGWDPDTDLDAATGDWVRRTWTTDEEAVAAVGEVLARSRAAVLDGLYIEPYAEQQVFALGLEPPPMMWIFKWDIVSGDSAALSAVYFASRGRVDEAIAKGESALGAAEEMRRALAGVDRTTFTDPAQHDGLAESLDYEVDLLRTLQSYRVLFLRYYEWLDTGSQEAQTAWQAELPEYRRLVAEHERTWGGNLDLPPYNFFAADAGMAHAERSGVARVGAWAVLVLSLLGLLLVPALRAGAFTPWRVDRAAASPGRIQRAAVIALPVLAVLGSRVALSGGRSPWFLVATLGSLVLLALAARLVLAWLRPAADPTWLWAALGGALLLRTVLLCAVMAPRGPGQYWFRFWTDDGVRTVYVTIAFALLVWSFVAVAVVLATAYGLRLRQGTGAVLAGCGAALLMLGGLLTASGLETGLTAINDQMAILPLGLSRILGLTVHLGIPQALPTWLLASGVVLALLGLLLSAGRRRHRLRDPAAPRAAP